MDAVVRHRLVSVQAILLALPPAGVTLALAIVAGAELAGHHPLTGGMPQSVPEAIVMRDEATAARLIDEGADVDAIGLIRAGTYADRAILATPLEAAVLADAAAAFDRLVARGATRTPNLGCLADDVGARAVRQRISGSSSCVRGAALAELLDRP